MEDALRKPSFVLKGCFFIDYISSVKYHSIDDGFRNSKLISHELITAFVPFLPLEKEHVVMCIKDALKGSEHEGDDGTVDKIIGGLNFENAHGLEFSSQGCKRVTDRIREL